MYNKVPKENEGLLCIFLNTILKKVMLFEACLLVLVDTQPSFPFPWTLDFSVEEKIRPREER